MFTNQLFKYDDQTIDFGDKNVAICRGSVFWVDEKINMMDLSTRKLYNNELDEEYDEVLHIYPLTNSILLLLTDNGIFKVDVLNKISTNLHVELEFGKRFQAQLFDHTLLILDQMQLHHFHGDMLVQTYFHGIGKDAYIDNMTFSDYPILTYYIGDEDVKRVMVFGSECKITEIECYKPGVIMNGFLFRCEEDPIRILNHSRCIGTTTTPVKDIKYIFVEKSITTLVTTTGFEYNFIF